MDTRICVCLFVLPAILGGPLTAGVIDMPLVTVGDAGNAPDPDTGYGAVSYAYAIGKYDVTTAQYAAFLNSVATSSDPYGLYNSKMATDLPTSGITQTSSSSRQGHAYALYYNVGADVLQHTARDGILLLCLVHHAWTSPTPSITRPRAATAARTSSSATTTASASWPSCPTTCNGRASCSTPTAWMRRS
jgi:hypothetical protein